MSGRAGGRSHSQRFAGRIFVPVSEFKKMKTGLLGSFMWDVVLKRNETSGKEIYSENEFVISSK
jgi:hypothetical protein